MDPVTAVIVGSIVGVHLVMPFVFIPGEDDCKVEKEILSELLSTPDPNFDESNPAESLQNQLTQSPLPAEESNPAEKDEELLA